MVNEVSSAKWDTWSTEAVSSTGIVDIAWLSFKDDVAPVIGHRKTRVRTEKKPSITMAFLKKIFLLPYRPTI